MSVFKKILIAVDFSEASDLAFERGVALAKAHGAEVHVLNVYHLPTYALPDGAFLPGPEAVAQIIDAAHKEVSARIAKAQSTGVTFHAHGAEGAVHEEILRKAKALGVDLVVVGTHGRTGLAKFVLGSVAERVVRTSDVPVLTVRRGGPDDRAVAWPPRSVVVGYDFSDASKRALTMARRLRADSGAKITVVHVFVDPWDDHQAAGAALRETAKARVDAYRKGIEALLGDHVRDCFGPDAKDVTAELVTGHAAEAVLDVAAKRGADLVCVGASGKDAVERALLGSVAQKVLQRAAVPVLVAS